MNARVRDERVPASRTHREVAGSVRRNGEAAHASPRGHVEDGELLVVKNQRIVRNDADRGSSPDSTGDSAT